MTAQQHRIFVSHSHLDNDFGTKLAQDLRRVLADESAVWYDVLGLHGGASWWQKILEELTARDVFILILSPDAMRSRWVLREIDIALNEDKFILPLLYRTCTVRADLKIIQIISFLSPKTYEAAFQEVLVALGLPTETVVKPKPQKVISSPNEPGTALLRQIETAFGEQDWSDVIRKVNYLLKHMPDAASSAIYRMQGLALFEEGQIQLAQEALETALALVEDRQQRLTILSDYTALLARQERWAEVLQRTKEVLRLVPNDPGWLATQQRAQSKLQGEPIATTKTEWQTQQTLAKGNLSHPANLKYSKTDEWVRVEGDQATIGITDYAQDQLDDIVYIELPWEVGLSVSRGGKFGDIESVKATAEIFSPISGEVIKVNEALKDQPELINDSPYEDGWMIVVKMSNSLELDILLSADEYNAYLQER